MDWLVILGMRHRVEVSRLTTVIDYDPDTKQQKPCLQENARMRFSATTRCGLSVVAEHVPWDKGLTAKAEADATPCPHCEASAGVL